MEQVAEPANTANSTEMNTGYADPTPDNILSSGLITDEGLKESASLAKFKDVNGLAKSYVELEKFRGNSIQIPQDDDAEKWNKVYSKLGVPETTDGYEVEEREYNGLKFDRASYSDFFDFAKSINLSTKQVKALVDYDFDRSTTAHKKLESDRVANEETMINGLKTEFGDKYDSTENTVKGLIQKFTNEEKNDIIVSKVLKDPDLFNLMASISSNFAEDSLEQITINNQSLSQDEARAEYDRMFNDKKGPLYDKSHPDHSKAQDKHLALFKRMNNIK